MHNPGFVGCMNRARKGLQERGGIARRQWLFGESLLEIDSIDELQHKIGPASVLIDLMDRNDVRVLKPGRHRALSRNLLSWSGLAVSTSVMVLIATTRPSLVSHAL